MTVPYHELAAEVERLRGQVDSLLPFGQVLLAAEKRAADAEDRARTAERESREADRVRDAAIGTVDDLRARIAELGVMGESERKAYRRGYGAGYTAARRGAESDPDGALGRGRGRPRK